MLVIHKGGRGRLRELFITGFKVTIQMGFRNAGHN